VNTWLKYVHEAAAGIQPIFEFDCPLPLDLPNPFKAFFETGTGLLGRLNLDLKIEFGDLRISWPDANLDFEELWSMLTIKMDYDIDLGKIAISALKDGLDIILPSFEIGFPYLDKPDSIHSIGANLNLPSIPFPDFFNGFIFDFELHPINLPKLDLDLKLGLPNIPFNLCGPF